MSANIFDKVSLARALRYDSRKDAKSLYLGKQEVAQFQREVVDEWSRAMGVTFFFTSGQTKFVGMTVFEVAAESHIAVS